MRRFRLTHGWFMSAANRIRPGLVVVVAFMAAGCGRSTPTPLGVTNKQAPRLIELPANLRPLLPDQAARDTEAAAGSIRVQYQQPQPPTDARPAYNIELAAPPRSEERRVGKEG